MELEEPSAQPGGESKNTPSPDEWRAWNDRVTELCRRHVRDRDGVEEVRQRIMLHLFQEWERVKWFPAWASIAVRHAAARRARELHRTDSHQPLGSLASEPSYSDLVESRILAVEALTRLAPVHRRVLLLRWMDLTHEEIARHLRCNVNQVGPRIERAHRAARAIRDAAPALDAGAPNRAPVRRSASSSRAIG